MSEAADAAGGAPYRALTAGEFERIRRLAHEKFGLDLKSGKEELVTARLGKQMRQAHFRSFAEYCRHVLEDHSGEALAAMIDALTTNYTSFFREPAHFDLLRREILPPLAGRGCVRLWSAACATGEEPYTLAMCAWEALGPARCRILATDISTRALAAARQAIYAAERCEGIPPVLARKYLLRAGGSRGWYRVKPELRAAVEFRRLNLVEGFGHVGTFPAIFCRNVMIYFDRATRERLVNRLAACLEPGGYLLVGHAESLTGIAHGLEYVRPAVYRRAGGAGGWR